ncbi:MAG: sulfite exporter TauE/SafE family protein [Ignavibacteria bacterium]|nr:sulfite exporter TauE/SafE family protein [Ignavibacteria bacterium]
MSEELLILSLTAASIGFFHTLFGPDHYLPFIVMSKARNWSREKTVWITALCGVGHILGSVVLGLIGVVAGIAISNIDVIESFRGELAAWLFIAFGLVYFAWGLKKAIRNKPHTHLHIHENGSKHSHTHKHEEEHLHAHENMKKKNITPWILFTIFVFGPCEPLIPLLMYPAAQENAFGVAVVAIIFGFVTVTTMLTLVILASWGISFVSLGKLERYTHAFAGAAIFMSGLAIQFLGL